MTPLRPRMMYLVRSPARKPLLPVILSTRSLFTARPRLAPTATVCPPSDSTSTTTSSSTTVPQQHQDQTAVLPIEQLLLERRKQEYVALYPDRDLKELERYLPSSDPRKFLVEEEKLSPQERRYQKLFAGLPWLAFVGLLSIPYLLVRFIQDGVEKKKGAKALIGDVGVAAVEQRIQCRGVERVPLAAMVDVIEGLTPAVVLLYSSRTFHSQLVLPMFYEVGEIFRKHRLEVRFLALDLSSEASLSTAVLLGAGTSAAAPATSTSTNASSSGEGRAFLQLYPPACAPYVQVLARPSCSTSRGFPRAPHPDDVDEEDQETVVHDYPGSWSCRELVLFALQHCELSKVDAADEVLAEAGSLEERWLEFREHFVAERFVDGDAGGGPQGQDSVWARTVQGFCRLVADGEALHSADSVATETIA